MKSSSHLLCDSAVCCLIDACMLVVIILFECCHNGSVLLLPVDFVFSICHCVLTFLKYTDFLLHNMFNFPFQPVSKTVSVCLPATASLPFYICLGVETGVKETTCLTSAYFYLFCLVCLQHFCRCLGHMLLHTFCYF